jgi:carboxypeptidase C (cathepsin A)
VGSNYSRGGTLTRNEFSWNLNANLVFLESPAAVGFSIDGKNDTYNDKITAEDNYQALLNFFNGKFPELRGRQFFIAGESYAGKYIPDLARLALDKGGLNLKGILVGNGIFSFKNGEKTKSMMEYMLSHHWIEAEYRNMY